jgi:hypothetical protein
MISDFGRWLIIFGIGIVIVGVALLALGRIPWLGHLPGDIVIERGNFRLSIPLATMLLISLVVTLLANLIARFWR